MAKRAFTLPDGLKLSVTEDRIDLEFDGDVEIEQNLGRRLGSVVVSGDLTVTLDVIDGDLRAGGVLRLHGEVDAGNLHAREVVLGKQGVKARAISASEKITIGAATVNADVIIAPEVNIDPKAQGRVTVIESGNDRNATKIKGGFGLADYEDMFGNSAEFLAQRGVAPLGQTPASPPPVATPTPTAPPAPTRGASASVKPAPPRSTAPPAPARAASAVPQSETAKTRGDEEEDTDDPLSLSLDDLEPLVEQGAKPTNDELHHRLSDALGRITACYEGTDLPPAVMELKDLVEQRDYDALRQNITEVWNGLLGFHQKRGIRPHHQVTHAFNVIHGLVQG